MTHYVFPTRKYYPVGFDQIENIEAYQPGGFCPVCIGEVLSGGRYTLLHKLGAGGSSTVWLARDRDRLPNSLVIVRILRADMSAKHPEQIPDLWIPHFLRLSNPRHSSQTLLEIYDHFLVNSPNGMHRVLVYPFYGPSITDMSWALGKYSDITTSNILFRTSEHVLSWTDTELYTHLGTPDEEEMTTIDEEPVDSHAPSKVYEFVERVRLQDHRLMVEDVVLIDFGQSYSVHHPPEQYHPGTAISYWSPEMQFEGRVGFESDIWGLACVIFHARTGFALFDGFWGSPDIILRKTVETLGRLPDEWWKLYQQRALFFHENGSSKTVEKRTICGGGPWLADGSIREKLRLVGTKDHTSIYVSLFPPERLDEGPMCEKAGVSLDNKEVEMLGDLLERMLAYKPEERLTIGQVLEHPWFRYC